MIATLHGTVTEKIADTVVLDVHGVGYGLLTTGEDFGTLAVGQSAKVYIYEHIREQAHDLFGFLSLVTKQLFELLLGVNGVGPKMALSVLSIGREQDVRAAIAGGDIKYIQSASGVGKRVAERIVVDLKDKIGLPSDGSAIISRLTQVSALNDEALTALVGLGYSQQDAEQMLAQVDTALSVEDRIKFALRQNR